MPTQAERTEATRGRLISTARRLFGEKGFAATSTEQILSEAEVSRGALYHHFSSKTDLFRATFEAVEEELTAKLLETATAGGETDPIKILELGFNAFLDQCLNPEVQRIVMLDAPTVLGWDTWHELDERYAFGTIKAVLAVAADSGRIEAEAVDSLTHLLVGAVMQAGMVVARADDPAAAKQLLGESFALLVSTL
ncbi:MAG TPA: TetR/AcrR family transcriptional regulator [Acidimicrobiales bacterium]|nr:TetR/AcrR family transcriptional regulator [Acidimicrobiales bacterium]